MNPYDVRGKREKEMEPLTRRQQDTLNYIADVRSAKGISPTLQEIASAFSLCIGSVYDHITALRRKGYLAADRYARRASRLTRGRSEWKVRQSWRNDFDKRFGARLQGETDLLRIFAIVREEFPLWLDVGKAELRVYDAARRELRDEGFYRASSATDRLPAEALGGAKAGQPDPLVAKAFRLRKPVIEETVAAVPIPGRDQVLGLLRLADPRPGGFHEVTTARAGLAAAALVVPLERAELEALRREVAELRKT